MIEVTLDADKIIKDMQALSSDLQKKAVRAGLTPASRPFRDSMKSLVPTKTGALRESINVRTISKGASFRLGSVLENKLKPDQVAVIVGPNKKVNGGNVNWIANILEGGAEAHDIKPRGESRLSIVGVRRLAKALKFEGGGFAKTAHHPGIRARFFMKRAFESSGDASSQLFFKGVQNYLNKRQKLSKG